jgi:hypothetical protein
MLAKACKIPGGTAREFLILAGDDFDLAYSALMNYGSLNIARAHIINERFKRLEERNDSE